MLLSALRCKGQDNGCCATDEPCDEGDGDCDSDDQCSGSLICGHDNCPWKDNDDCCMKKPGRWKGERVVRVLSFHSIILPQTCGEE